MNVTAPQPIPANAAEAALAYAWLCWIDANGPTRPPTIEHLETYSRLPRDIIERELQRMSNRGR